MTKATVLISCLFACTMGCGLQEAHETRRIVLVGEYEAEDGTQRVSASDRPDGDPAREGQDGGESLGRAHGTQCPSPETCPGLQPVTGASVDGTAPSTAGPQLPDFLDEIPCNGLDEDKDGSDLCLGDADGDGVPADFDCDDLDAYVSPLEPEVRCDGVDQNCDGFDDCDTDEDGVLDRHDCDADDPDVNVNCFTPDKRPDPVI